MAVIATHETGNRRLSRKIQGNKVVREYERTFEVFTDDKEDDGRVVMTEADVPQLNDPYMDSNGVIDGGAFCDDVSPQCSDENPYQWTVSAHYTSEVDSEAIEAQDPGDDGDNASTDPIFRPTIINYSTRARTRVAEFDYSVPPKQYVNSAGQQFDPPVEEEILNMVIHVIRNEATANPNTIALYTGACNRGAWGGFAEYQARITSWTADQQNEQGQTFYQHKYEIEVQTPSWEIKVLDAGDYEIVGGNQVSLAVDNKGVVMHGRGLLDGNGAKLADDADPVYITFRRYPLRNFNTLKLP